MKKFAIFMAMIIAGMALAAELKTPETSRLFQKYVEPETKTVSYILKSDIADNLQSMYFTQKSMTEDGRYLVLMIQGGKHGAQRHMAYIDFLTDTIDALTVPAGGAEIPYLDTETAKLYYVDRVRGFFYRDLRADAHKEVKLCDIPEEITKLGKISHVCTHLTLTRDRKKAFCDFCVADRFIYGLVDFASGKFERWGEADFFLNHGQLNPKNDDIAIAAWEVSRKDSKGVVHKIHNLPIEEAKKLAYPNAKFNKIHQKEGVYPRVWLVTKDGKRYLIPPVNKKNYATHEDWTEDGEAIYYCGNGILLFDLKSGKTSRITAAPAAHATFTADRKYVTYDAGFGKWWRGASWRVAFLNRETGKEFYFYPPRPPYTDAEHPSKLHPDPHPHFVCGDKYVVCTVSFGDGNMHLSITPVKELVNMTR